MNAGISSDSKIQIRSVVRDKSKDLLHEILHIGAAVRRRRHRACRLQNTVTEGKHLQCDEMVEIEELNHQFDNALGPTTPLKPFRLLDLPPELWLRIIELVVVADEPIEITRASDNLRQALLVQQPPLTRVCRLLRREALPMYYQKNIFSAKHICGVACPRRWFAAVGQDNLRLMRRFLFHATFQPDFWATKFAEMGLKVDIQTIRDSKTSTPAGFRRLDTLVINFL